VEICCADHATLSIPQKLALTSPTGGGRSVGIDRLRTEATEISLVMLLNMGLKTKGPELAKIFTVCASIFPYVFHDVVFR
jgi:hypothetical protein